VRVHERRHTSEILVGDGVARRPQLVHNSIFRNPQVFHTSIAFDSKLRQRLIHNFLGIASGPSEHLVAPAWQWRQRCGLGWPLPAGPLPTARSRAESKKVFGPDALRHAGAQMFFQ
jgi:hypothetical protein